jgi:hypothetical protein
MSFALLVTLFLIQMEPAVANGPRWVGRELVVDFLSLENRLQDAVRRDDVAGIDALLAAEFESVTVTDSATGLTRAEWLSDAPERGWTFSLNEVRSRCLVAPQALGGHGSSPCLAVSVSGMLDLQPAAERRKRPRPFLVDLWIPREGKWQLVSRTTTLPAHASGPHEP